MIQQTANPVKIKIKNLFHSILKSIIPQAFKICKIVPVHRPGRTKLLLNHIDPFPLTQGSKKHLTKSSVIDFGGLLLPTNF